VKISRPKLKTLSLLAVDFIVGAAFAANLVVVSAARNRTYSDVGRIPHRSLGLVLGCPIRVSDGRLNLFFLARVRAAAELYRQGKVDYLVATGDENTPEDDEPAELRSRLITEGVPIEKIFMDYAGFSTLDSVIRAKELFGQSRITIISQEFQNQRAIFIATHSGLDAIGFNAADVFSVRNVVRESLARVRAMVDVYLFRTRRRDSVQTTVRQPLT
jgi:SanA protein